VRSAKFSDVRNLPLFLVLLFCGFFFFFGLWDSRFRPLSDARGCIWPRFSVRAPTRLFRSPPRPPLASTQLPFQHSGTFPCLALDGVPFFLASRFGAPKGPPFGLSVFPRFSASLMCFASALLGLSSGTFGAFFSFFFPPGPLFSVGLGYNGFFPIFRPPNLFVLWQTPPPHFPTLALTIPSQWRAVVFSVLVPFIVFRTRP